ncbi:MAG TPA: YdeI/OmpD-associated family protein [Candidatus Limnocylindrales bacterium]|nr:YdeI/OmpD-associated family protein [Candidatus Limnocylindrales bacterium]
MTETLDPPDRAAWRAWLASHHADRREIWLILHRGESAPLTYLDAVEEGLCFGWIDGIQKKLDATRAAQRFTPRRRNSHWTELNKERARRLIAAGLMTEAGHATLPDLSPEAFRIAPDILAALQSDPQTWANFQAFPEVYRRIRVGYIEEMRRQPAVFQTRLANFLRRTRQNRMFGTLE